MKVRPQQRWWSLGELVTSEPVTANSSYVNSSKELETHMSEQAFSSCPVESFDTGRTSADLIDFGV